MSQPLNRKTLKSYFLNGKRPDQEQFGSLIDSMLNLVDDGFEKDKKNGLVISAVGSSEKLITFFDNIHQKSAAWSFSLDQSEGGLSINDANNISRLFIKNTGEVGIGTKSPNSALEVAGDIGMQKRIGTKYQGAVPGDGYWHPITPKLDECIALEVMAKIRGEPKSGRYAITHAIAISTFGQSNCDINTTRAWYGSKNHSIELKWSGSLHAFFLEARTKTIYKAGRMIEYSIMEL